MWFLSACKTLLTRRAVPEAETRPNRSVPAPTKKSGRRRPLVLEVLEDRFAPAALLQQSFLPPPAFASQTSGHFGTSTATDSNTHVVGMPYADVGGFVDSGAAFVYNATTGALIATLANPTPGSNDFLAIPWRCRGMVVVGAPGTTRGALVVARLMSLMRRRVTLMTTLANPSPSSEDLFGIKVAVSGNTVGRTGLCL